MDTEKQSLRPSPLLLQTQKRKKKERKKHHQKASAAKKRRGAFHSLQNAGEKRLTRCSARDKDTTKKCASKVALIQRTKTTIKCSHADRTVFCLLLDRKTCVGFRAGESQLRFRLGQKPSVYSSTTIVRYEWGESNKKRRERFKKVVIFIGRPFQIWLNCANACRKENQREQVNALVDIPGTVAKCFKFENLKGLTNPQLRYLQSGAPRNCSEMWGECKSSRTPRARHQCTSPNP